MIRIGVPLTDFTPDEFAWVWAEAEQDEYPYPISIIETPSTADEYAQLRSEISYRYPRNADPDLTAALRLLADPDLRIICTGKIHDSTRKLRSLAVATGDAGAVLFQMYGATAEFGGALRLVVTRPQNLGKHIAATMHSATPGRAGPMTGYTPRVRGDEPPTTWFVPSDGDLPPEERIRALLRAPRTAEGHVCIEQRRHSRNPYPPVYLNWIDITDNHPAAGRYLIDVGTDTTVIPASRDVIATELHRRAGLDIRCAPS
ncbi:ESX secretion-associated protein EspG [Nocardia brasiliensis]|uniref:ESX secretion-associated protein EspG n=1 Tax=Nocardia brasiliensis TaxID=37326 RepID=UPI001895BCC9|nr:ESX secretion-associated protein EspG [Nocardia brasiliensis]MBF6548501.1 ESX secretion-associated protein EspG [Nocardia brasiliensis]